MGIVDSHRREQNNQAQRRWRTRNLEKAKQATKKWVEKNKEKAREATRKWRINNPDKINERRNEWRKRNKERARQHSHNRRARKVNAVGSHTYIQTIELLEKQKWKCIYCLASLKVIRHLDHIIALKKGGTNDISNLQWLCQSCNCSKRAMDPIDWARKIGKLL